MENLPMYVSGLFIATTLLTISFFYLAAQKSTKTLLILFFWLALQGTIGLSGFYLQTDNMPPRFLLLVLPPLFLIISLFMTANGRQYLDQLNPKLLTLLHVVRIPVEIVLFLLFTHKMVPELMTFEGRNPDILSGITALFVFYFGYLKNKITNKWLIVWNVSCIFLLINIVAHAILSAPFPFQKLAFDQPNIGVLYFPFIWLPGCVVPLVLLSHLAVLRQLLIGTKIPERQIMHNT